MEGSTPNKTVDDERVAINSQTSEGNYSSINQQPQEPSFRPFFLQNEEETKSRREGLFNAAKQTGEYSVDDGMEYIGLGRYHYIWLFVYGISSMSQSVELTLTSVILSSIGCEWHLSLLMKVIIPCAVLIAAIPGDFLGGYFADIYGRKITLIVGQYLIAIFGVLSAFMPEYYSYLIVRCIVGFGFGITVVIVIVQTIELCPTSYRASAVALMFISWSIGVCYTVIGAYFLLHSKYGWRAVVLWAALPCVILCFIIPFMDESPKFLVISQNDNSSAREVMRKIADTNMVDYDIDDVAVLYASLEEERGTTKELVTIEHRCKTICFCICFFISNMLYIANVYDSAYLFEYGYCSPGYGSGSSCTLTLTDLLLDLIVCTGEFLSVPIVAVCSELMGRRSSVRLLAAIIAVITFACIWCFGGIVLLVELYLTRASTNAFLLLFFIYVPESYPTYMRSVAFGVTNLFSNLGGVAGILAVYLLGLGVSWRLMFIVLFIVSLIVVVITWILRHETVGTRLQDNREERDLNDETQ